MSNITLNKTKNRKIKQKKPLNQQKRKTPTDI